jgi:hypothetical protein
LSSASATVVKHVLIKECVDHDWVIVEREMISVAKALRQDPAEGGDEKIVHQIRSDDKCRSLS